MTPDLQKLASEYRAIEAMDRLLEQADSMTIDDLIGIEARLRRRREIISELASWISRAEVSARRTKSGSIQLVPVLNKAHPGTKHSEDRSG